MYRTPERKNEPPRDPGAHTPNLLTLVTLHRADAGIDVFSAEDLHDLARQLGVTPADAPQTELHEAV